MARFKEVTTHKWWALGMVFIIVLASADDMFRHGWEKRQKRIYAADEYYSITRVNIGDAVVGVSPVMNVDRIIKQPFKGEYLVEVRSFPQRTNICSGTGVHQYDTEATLPDVLTLAWWTDDNDCTGKDLDPGNYFVVTSWDIDRAKHGLPNAHVIIESNPFTITAISPTETQNAIETIQKLEEQVDNLREID